jgi:hypothetical protein
VNQSGGSSTPKKTRSKLARLLFCLGIVLAFLIVGAVAVGLMESLSVIDAIWFASVTLCTLGYGGTSPRVLHFGARNAM